MTGVFHFPYGTAPASRIKNIAFGFEANGFKVDVLGFCPPPGESVINSENWKELSPKVRYRYLLNEVKESTSIKDKLIWFAHNWKVGKIISEIFQSENKVYNYDLIFLYGRNYSILSPIVKTAKSFNVPIISDLVELPRTSINKLSFLNPIHLDQHYGLKNLVLHSTVLTVITKYLADFVGNPKNIYLLPSVQDWSSVTSIYFSSKNSKIEFTYVGNLINRDEPKLMFDFILLVSKKLDICLNLVGRFMNNVNGKEWIKIVEKDNTLSKVVNIIGEVGESEKQKIYDKTSVFILPRRNHKDEVASFPTRLVEFLLERKPVLVAPIGDIPHYLSEEEVFYLDQTNIKKSVDNFIKHWTNEKTLNVKVNKGICKAKLVFDSNTHIEKIIKMIYA